MSTPTQTKRNIPTTPDETTFGLFLWGGREKFDRRKAILEAFIGNPIFSKKTVTTPSLARKDAWTRAALQSRELIRLKLKHDWPHRQFMEAVRFTDNMLPVQPQFRIFMSNLESQMSDEQKAIWIPKAERFEIFGSYSQTELGHGSNVRGIETTSTFDPATDEFIINSPTTSSTKYWIGATGVWATHSIVVARLIVNGKEYGNHLFLTQLQNLDTQELMPGVKIYEMGPKVFQGMLGTDNGALRFHNVRVPRAQMLARNAQVLRDGTYVAPKNTKHSYGSMVTVRALMAEITGWDLLKAVTVAYHYTTFRRQFDRDHKGEETPVFDYASVRYRLMPLLAQASALVLVGQNIKRAYDTYTENYLLTNDTSELEDLHLQTVGAKVYSTEITGHGIETCRISCGGHGYNALSGFGRMYANAINAVTYEGDNYVVAQQVPRAILKHFKAKTESSLSSLSYLSFLRTREPPEPIKVHTTADWLLRDRQRFVLEQRLVTLVQNHMDDTEAGKDTSFSTHALTMAHGDFIYWKGFWNVVDHNGNEDFYPSLNALAQVFSLSILQNAHFALTPPLSLPQKARNLLAEAYRNAINDLADSHVARIIDAYGFTEYELDSALARADETPYEALLNGAKKSEMNNMQHLWPMMVDTRRIWREVEQDKQRGQQAKL
ncbi:acyl-CoA dehydrogenase/oxidase C-terminal [Exophiala viscosa]|uniref:Acyl-coenzyme A oxidase n=1 Tax=Exophiala viscosa TaxID=2486360 RepID=A0AAN6DTT4_9EURO|nr:acyl-CoA dehydrogenase/oxidase C-terminal [Exophiala viscosa]